MRRESVCMDVRGIIHGMASTSMVVPLFVLGDPPPPPNPLGCREQNCALLAEKPDFFSRRPRSYHSPLPRDGPVRRYVCACVHRCLYPYACVCVCVCVRVHAAQSLGSRRNEIRQLASKEYETYQTGVSRIGCVEPGATAEPAVACASLKSPFSTLIHFQLSR